MILIAGVGNVFFGDDGFGVEVARRLATEALPDGVRVVDFGIRGLHLAYELLEPIDLLVIVDTVSRGGAPGSLYVIEPDTDGVPAGPDAHSMDLGWVFATVRSMGGALPPIRLVGCEPASIEERLGLGEEVASACGPAVQLVREIVSFPAREDAR